MTLKHPWLCKLLLVIGLIVMCSGCAAFSPFEDVQAFRPRGTTPIQPTTQSQTQTQAQGLGDVVVSQSVDSDNCAVNPVTIFNDTDPVYVVLEYSAFPAGTTFFARMYEENRILEDSDELTADQDYGNVCVSFVFEPTASAQVWQPGQYEIELFVNGNSYGSAAFEIR